MNKNKDFTAEISSLQCFRNGWALDISDEYIREGWNSGMTDTKKVLFELYEISSCIILALQDMETGSYHDAMPMTLVRQKLTELVESDAFKNLSIFAGYGRYKLGATPTKRHIREMFRILKILKA